MLKALRHKGLQKNIYIFLAVTVVVSFVVSGVLISRDDKKTGGALGVIDKRPVSVQQYLDSYRAVQRQAAFMYGDKLNEMRSRINFKGEAWDRLLLLDYAGKHKIGVSDVQVVSWITSQPAFQNKGRFDEKLYALYIERALRSTPRAFEEEIRQMLTIVKVQESIQSSSTPADDKLKELYRGQKTEKDIQYAVLPWESLKDQVPVNDKETDRLFDMMKGTMTDKDGKPMSPEQAREQIKNLSRQQPATELAVKKLAGLKEKLNGADFEAAAKAEGLQTASLQQYHAGIYPAGIYPSEGLQNAVSALNEGGISDVFEVPQGAMIVKVTKVHPFDEKKFDQEKKAFKKEQSEKQMGEAMNGLLEKLRKSLTLNLERMKEMFPEEPARP